MSRSLTLKLVWAFLIVSITGTVLAAVLTRWMSVREFNRLVVDQAQSNFVNDASIYYESNGSWQGVMAYMGQRARVAQPQQPPQPGNQPPAAAPFVFMLADENGVVVVPAGQYRPGDSIPANGLAEGEPVEIEGRVVGTVLATGNPPALDPLEEQYLTRTNLALFYAALGATVMALILGGILARTLTRPLRELTTAVGGMAKGDLKQQVPVRSQDELGELTAAFNQMSTDLAHANQLRR